MSEPDGAYGPPAARRDLLLATTLRLHDLRYGTGHCDRKYVQVCSRFQELLFDAAGANEPDDGKETR